MNFNVDRSLRFDRPYCIVPLERTRSFNAMFEDTFDRPKAGTYSSSCGSVVLVDEDGWARVTEEGSGYWHAKGPVTDLFPNWEAELTPMEWEAELTPLEEFPQHPIFSQGVKYDEAYYIAVQKVTDWYKSAQLGAALAKVIKANDLAAYLHLERNYLRCRGLGRKSWSALLEEVGQGR